MGGDFDDYSRAHKIFVRKNKSIFLKIRELYRDWRTVTSFADADINLEDKIRSLLPEVWPPLIKAVVLSPEATVVFKERFGREYNLISQEAESYRQRYADFRRPFAEELKQSVREFPFNRVAADILISNGLTITLSHLEHYFGIALIGKYAILLSEDLDDTKFTLTLLHECGHIFYQAGSSAGRLKIWPTIEDDPVEREFDRMAAEAIERDPGLAKYIYYEVQRNKGFEGFVEQDKLPKYWRKSLSRVLMGSQKQQTA